MLSRRMIARFAGVLLVSLAVSQVFAAPARPIVIQNVTLIDDRSAAKIADLVLLDQNPLEDIANTKKINAVIANGRLFRKPELDAMLETVAKEAPNR